MGFLRVSSKNLTLLENGKIHIFCHIAKTHPFGKLVDLIFLLGLDKQKEIKDLLHYEAESQGSGWNASLDWTALHGLPFPFGGVPIIVGRAVTKSMSSPSKKVGNTGKNEELFMVYGLPS